MIRIKEFFKLKHIAISLLLIAFLLAPIGSAHAEQIEIRSPIFSGPDLSTISHNSTSFFDFAGFYYDIDDNIGSERMSFIKEGNDVIPAGNLVYTTTMQNVRYAYSGWADSPCDNSYTKISFLGGEYIPVNHDPQILTKLILDDDEKIIMTLGQTLELGEGFAITPKQIDFDGVKVFMELTKDGQIIDAEIFNIIDNTANSSWDYDTNIGGEEDIVMMRVHINEILQDGENSLVVIEGIWLISNEAMEIADDEEFGILEVSSATSTSLVLKTNEDIVLSKDRTIDLTNNIKIKTADSDDLRFCFIKEITNPGTYEIRGSVATTYNYGPTAYIWDATNFAGFYYDLDDNIASEKLTVIVDGNNRTIAEDNLTYTSQLQTVSYTYEGWASSPVDNTYNKIGLFADEYVPINQNISILSKIIMDDDEKYTMRVNQSLELGGGFAITPRQIDANGSKVWLELTKDGVFLDDDVFNTENNMDNSSWDYDATVGNIDDVVVMRIHINEVFKGQVDSLVIIEGIWLISDVTEQIKIDDEFGKLEVISITPSTITMDTTTDITLNADSIEEIAEGLNFRISDSADTDVRFYPFTGITIGGLVEEPVDEEPVDEEPVEDDGASGEIGLNTTVLLHTISIEVNQSYLEFGELLVGSQSEPQAVLITNTGTCNLTVTTELSSDSDQFYYENLFINNNLWNSYSQIIGVNMTDNAQVAISVPANYSSGGLKQGTIELWAEVV